MLNSELILFVAVVVALIVLYVILRLRWSGERDAGSANKKSTKKTIPAIFLGLVMAVAYPIIVLIKAPSDDFAIIAEIIFSLFCFVIGWVINTGLIYRKLNSETADKDFLDGKTYVLILSVVNILIGFLFLPPFLW